MLGPLWRSTVQPFPKHYYYKSSGGRPPCELRVMLRIHFLQRWHNLSDPLMEEALYDRLSFQTFLGFDSFGGVIPGESSICRFQHLLEEHGLVLKEGTIVDATLLATPVSKNNTWHFGAKGYIGVQAQG